MRGTTYAIAEIIWWMLAAAAIGFLIGWILRRWFDGGGRLKQVRAELDEKSSRYAELSSELGDFKLKAEGLNSDLATRTEELNAAQERAGELEGDLAGIREELAASGSQVINLEASLADSRGELEAAAGRATELESRIGTITSEKDAEIERLAGQVAGIAGLESTISQRNASVSELEARLEAMRADLGAREAELTELRTMHAECGVVAEERTGRIAGLEASLAERDARIGSLEQAAAIAPSRDALTDLEARVAAAEETVAARTARIEELESQLSAVEDAAAAGPAPVVAPAAAVATPPATRFGTPGADHADDLKVINGIGPKMEELLNGFGIQSWEQLAGLTPADVAKVDAALEEFPGRIERDEWVAQAATLVKRFPDPNNRPDRTALRNQADS